MRLHYVASNPLEAKLFKVSKADFKDMDLTISPSLNDLDTVVSKRGVDCLFLDVYRPEAISLEEDVRTVREHTPAPIFFITRGEVRKVRMRALRAGAMEVFTKSNMTRDALYEILLSAKTQCETQATITDMEWSPKDLPNHDLKNVQSTLRYMQFGLAALQSEEMNPTMLQLLEHLTETAQTLEAYSASDLSGSCRVPFIGVIEKIKSHIHQVALEKSLKLSLDVENVMFDQIGPAPLACLGVQHLLDGFMKAARKPGMCHVDIVKHNSGARMSIYFDQVVLKDADIILKSSENYASLSLDSYSSIQLGLLLLGTCKEQIHILGRETYQKFVITL